MTVRPSESANLRFAQQRYQNDLHAALFGLWHIPSHGFGAFMPLALGFLLGWMRLRSGRLGPGMALHAIHNGVLVLLTIALKA